MTTERGSGTSGREAWSKVHKSGKLKSFDSSSITERKENILMQDMDRDWVEPESVD
jgi:hypothetical protein